MDAQRVLDALNSARSRELAVIIQYMRQHYTVVGIESPPAADLFKSTAITEMKHAESLGERIDFLGGEPTIKPDPIKVSSDLTSMLKDDLASEMDAISLYKDIIKTCEAEGDIVSRRMMEEILGDEEDHVNEFETLLGK